MALEVPPSAGAMRRGVPLGHAAATRAHCHILFPHLHSPALAYIRPESRERGAVEENVDGRRFFARQVKRGAGMAQHDPRAGLFRRDRRAEKPEPLPPIPLEYFFEAPKRHMVRGMALLALGQLGLVGGFSPYFWMHMPGFSDLWRGLFISGLSVVAFATLASAGPAQRRYVATVTKNTALGPKVRITTSYFLTSTNVDVLPSEISLSVLSLKNLLGRHDPVAEDITAKDPRPLEERPLFTILVKNKKLMVDTEGMDSDERRELQRVLGIWRPIAPPVLPAKALGEAPATREE